ncbi:MAG: aspartate kinase [Planctomycetota bacterium]
MKVLKFGGASLKDGNSLKAIASVVSATKGPKAIVLSAFNGVTDELNNFLGRILSRNFSEKQISSFVNKLKLEHLEYLKQACLRQDFGRQALSGETYRLIEGQCNRLERLLYGLRYIDEITERSRDLINSFGERLSVIVASEALRTYPLERSVPATAGKSGALNNLGINCRALEADKIGVLTDGLFGRSSAVLPAVRRNMRRVVLPLVRRNIVPVITGYFGCDRHGRTTTFGRGGSDYSASVIAYALDADVLELWKDVDGFMSADPEIIPQARLIKHLSYKEAAELAYFGSGILHPRTVEPVLLKNIPIIIRNTFTQPLRAGVGFDRRAKGTVIHNYHVTHSIPIKGITYEKEIGFIKVHGYGSGFGYKSEVVSEITGRLLSANINIKSILSAPTGIGLVFGREDFDAAFLLLSRTCLQQAGAMKLVSGFEKVLDRSLIAFVGEGITREKGVAAKVFNSLAKKRINVEMISAGASSAAGFFIVHRRDLKKTVRTLYKEFFG